MLHEHGGNIYKYEQKMLDFSANINPYGIPQAVKDAMKNSIELCINYPDITASSLRKELEKTYNFDANSFFCGNGAADIFYRLSRAINPKNAIITAPTFSEYELALLSVNCNVKHHNLKKENGFNLTYDFLSELTNQIDVCILCNPNNPTGCVINPQLMFNIVNLCAQNNIYLILDECFIDFLTDEMKYSALKYLNDNKNIVIVRTFTKMFAIAGVRIGWCVSTDKRLIDRLYDVDAPWNTSIIAQHCGISALKLKDYSYKTAENIEALRKQLEIGLKQFDFDVFSSYANYILFYTKDYDLHTKLEKEYILIRNCENYHGLGRGFYRVAVKSENENLKLINTIKKVL